MAARQRVQADYRVPDGFWSERMRQAPGEWAAFTAVHGDSFHEAGLGVIPTWEHMINGIVAFTPAPALLRWGSEHTDLSDPQKPSAVTQERLLGIDGDGTSSVRTAGFQAVMWWAGAGLLAAPPAPTARAEPAHAPPGLPCNGCTRSLDGSAIACVQCGRRYHRACAPNPPPTDGSDSAWLCRLCSQDDVAPGPAGGSRRDDDGYHGGRSGSHGNVHHSHPRPGPSHAGPNGTVASSPAGTGSPRPDGTRGGGSAAGPPVPRRSAHTRLGSMRPGTLLPFPPDDLARRVLAAAPSTTLHIPRSALPSVARFGLHALVSLAWQLANNSTDLPEYNILEVGVAIICQTPARASYTRERAALILDGKWGDAVALLNRHRAAETVTRPRRGGRDPSHFIKRARQCMQEGAVSRATRALGAWEAAQNAASEVSSVPDLNVVAAHFPPEDRPGLDPAACPPLAQQLSVSSWHTPQHHATGPCASLAAGAAPSLPWAPRSPIRDWWERRRPGQGGSSQSTGAVRRPYSSTDGDDNWDDAPPDGDLPAPADRLLAPRAEEGLSGISADPFWPAIARALARGSRMAAPGPSGLRSEFLGEILGYKPLAAPIAAALTCVIDQYLAGQVPRSSIDTRMFLLPKSKGGIRPIGARERLTSLAARLAAGPLRDELEGPARALGQLGMSPAGTQRAAARVHDASRRGQHVLSLDERNAFNAISRRAVLAALPLSSVARPLVMRLYRDACYYRSAAPGPTIQASAGVVQGDPLAAMLFANAMAGILVGAADDARQHDVTFTPCPPLVDSPALAQQPALDGGGSWVAFADDVYIMSDRVEWAEIFAKALQNKLAGVGLELAKGHGKTAILRAPGPSALYTSAWMKEWVAEVTWLRCLGVPCAGPTDSGKRAVRDEVASKVCEASRAVSVLRLLDHPQHILTALRMAGAWSRCEYLLSQAPDWSFDASVVDELAAADLGLLAAALGPHGACLAGADGTRAVTEATLPVSMGGLGLRWAPHELEPARKHSSALIAALERDADASSTKRLRAATQRDRAEVHKSISLGMRAAAEEELLRTWSTCNAGGAGSSIAVPVPAALTHMARRAVLVADGGMAGRIWCMAASAFNGTLMPAAEAATAAATRLGLPLFDGTSRVACPLPCSTRGALDAYGWHSAGCAAVNATRERRTVAAVMACLEGPAGVTGHQLLTQRRCGDDGLPLPASADSGVGVDGDLVVVAPGATAAATTYMDFGSRSLRPSAPGEWVHTAENGCQPALGAYSEKWEAGLRRIAPRGARCCPVAYTPLGHVDARSVRGLREIAGAVDALDDIVPFGSALPRRERIICTTVAAIIGATAGCVNRARDALHLPAKPNGPSMPQIVSLVQKTSTTRNNFLVPVAAAAGA